MEHAVTRAQARQITADVEQALADVFAKHGLDLKIKSSKYGLCYAVSVEGVIAAPEGAEFNPNSREAQEYAANAVYYDLPADGLGRTFTMGTHDYMVVGLNLRARSMPVIAKRADGKLFKMPTDAVARALAAQV